MKRLLVVEDNMDYAALLFQCFSRLFDVTVVTNADVAGGVLATGGADGVLVDLMLPGLSGLSLALWMEDTSGLREVPVVVMTAARLSDSVRADLYAVASVKAVVDKTAGLPHLLSVVDEAVGGAALAAEAVSS